MKFDYDKKTDSLSVIFRNDEVDETEEIRPGVLADFNEEGMILSIEILNASKKVDSLNTLIFDNKSLELEVA
ncbi:MAG: hypothetical protein HW421_4079 [Ignavibacteria bacterium]|nr:hypothetical protein [Ignavibacteria bacterium]